MRAWTRSVGLDLAEAVRAVDRLVHARLERYLRLVAARRADRREVLARSAVVGALVAARATQRGRVVAAAVAGRTPVGAARGAALGVGGEPLREVVLLVRGGVDELHTAVHAVDGPIDVDHEAAPPERARRRGRCVRGDVTRVAGSGGESDR